MIPLTINAAVTLRETPTSREACPLAVAAGLPDERVNARTHCRCRQWLNGTFARLAVAGARGLRLGPLGCDVENELSVAVGHTP